MLTSTKATVNAIEANKPVLLRSIFELISLLKLSSLSSVFQSGVTPVIVRRAIGKASVTSHGHQFQCQRYSLDAQSDERGDRPTRADHRLRGHDRQRPPGHAAPALCHLPAGPRQEMVGRRTARPLWAHSLAQARYHLHECFVPYLSALRSS